MAEARTEGRDLQAEGRWDRIRGRVRSTWGSVTDDEIEQSRGNIENLIGRIKERTGQTYEDIRSKFDEWMGEENTEADSP